MLPKDFPVAALCKTDYWARLFGLAIVRFLIVTGSSFLISMLLTIGLHELLGLDSRIAFVAAVLTASTSNFFGLRYFVYRGQSQPILQQFGLFAVSTGMWRGVESVVYCLLEQQKLIDYRLLAAGLLLVFMLLKYGYYSMIFRLGVPQRFETRQPSAPVEMQHEPN